jgi:hypothetical protein
MQIAKRLGLVLLTVCAFSALAVSSASAGQPLFLASVPGSLLRAGSSGIQKFNVKAVSSVECTALKLLSPGDVAPAAKATSLLAVVDYEKCTVFGLAAVIHPVHYIIFANGLVRLVKDAVILGTGGCKVTVPAATNQSLWTVKFENTTANNGVLLLAKVAGISSHGEGGPAGLCNFEEKNEHEGTYEGAVHVTAAAGVIMWHPNA